MYGEVGEDTLMLGHRRRWSVSVIGEMSWITTIASSVGRRSRVLLHVVAELRRRAGVHLLRTIVGSMAEMGGDTPASTGTLQLRGTRVRGSIGVTFRRRAARRRVVIGRHYLRNTPVEQDTIRAMLARVQDNTVSGLRTRKIC